MSSPENLKGKTFREKPERINKNGRPRRFVSAVINDLEKRGIASVKPSQIVDLYERLMNCTFADLRELSADESVCWEVRHTATFMLKHPFEAWTDMKDRAHGKPKQANDINVNALMNEKAETAKLFPFAPPPDTQ